MNKENKTITIDLDKLDSTEVREEGELIFQDQFDLLVSKIRRKAQENSDWLKAQEPCGSKKKGLDEETRGVPSCFFIDGTRGSGKSTLMRAVRDALVKGKFKEDEENKICLYPLADVDPTELGRGENFFLYILGRIYKLLEAKYNNLGGEQDEDMEDIRVAMEDLRKMSGGLQVLLDSDAALKRTNTPEFFLEECIDKCADSSQLRQKLCALLGKVSKIVKRDIFVITIDDADLNFSKCEDVLEYVRKYMQTPRLIFLFAGDMQLYSHIVRGMQMRSFERELLKYDKQRANHRNHLLERIEDQYLLKIFPADNRICLNGYNKLMGYGYDLYLRVEQKGDKLFRDFVGEYLSAIEVGRYEELFLECIAKMPIRKAFFLCFYWARNANDKNKSNSLYLEAVIDGLRKISFQDFVNYNIDYTALFVNSINSLQDVLFEYHSRNNLWYENMSLVPRGCDSSSALVSMCLNAVVSAYTQYTANKLRYICACFPSYEIIRLHAYAKENQEEMTSIKNRQKILLNQLGAAECASVSSLECITLKRNNSDKATENFALGSIRLFNEEIIASNQNGYVRRDGCADFVSKILNAEPDMSENTLQYKIALSHALCQVNSEGESGRYYLSIYNLLVWVTEWLDLAYETSLRRAKNKREFTELLDMEKVDRLMGNGLVNLETILGKVQSSDADNRRQDNPESGKNDIRSIYLSVRARVVSWMENISMNPCINNAATLADFWDSFRSECEKIQKQYSADYTSEMNMPCAGKLLLDYMRAFEQAAELISCDGGTLSKCVAEFPFWAVLYSTSGRCGEMLTALNRVNMGSLSDSTKKATVAAIMERIEDAKRQVAVLERMLSRMSDEIKDAEDEKKELESEMKKREIILNARHADNDFAESVRKKLEDELSACKKAEEELALAKGDAEKALAIAQEKGLQAKGEYEQSENAQSRCVSINAEIANLRKNIENTTKIIQNLKMPSLRKKYENQIDSWNTELLHLQGSLFAVNAFLMQHPLQKVREKYNQIRIEESERHTDVLSADKKLKRAIQNRDAAERRYADAEKNTEKTHKEYVESKMYLEMVKARLADKNESLEKAIASHDNRQARLNASQQRLREARVELMSLTGAEEES